MTWRTNGSTGVAELELESPFVPEIVPSTPPFARETFETPSWSERSPFAPEAAAGALMELEGPYVAETAYEEEFNTVGFRQTAMQLAKAESQRWGNKTKKEYHADMKDTLKGYWKTLVSDSEAEKMISSRTAWSGAFISWLVKNAGAGSAFTYSAAHRVYVGAAKKAKANGDSSKFWAYRVTEAKPEIGDLICRDRESSSGVCGGTTYDNVDDGQARNTHSDLVVDIQSGKLIAIGGNVSDSVGETKVSLDSTGMIVQPSGCLWFAIMKPPGTGTIAAPSPTTAPAPAQPAPSTPSWFDTITSIPAKVMSAVREGLITLQVGEAIISGNRDENQLTNMLFFARHPELPPGYVLKKEDTQLAQDWLRARETVRTVLKAITASPFARV